MIGNDCSKTGFKKMNHKILSIQALRGIAVIAVLFVHFKDFFGDNKIFPTYFLTGGIWGVDLFFIISGFIAAYTIPIKNHSPSAGLDYLVNRIIRIVPLYYLLTISSFGADSSVWWISLKSLLFIPAGGAGDYFGFLGPIYGGARIAQGWTLNYEMYFYIIVSASFIFSKNKWFFAIGALLTIILAPLLAYGAPVNYLSEGFRFPITYFSMVSHPIILEFISGVMLGLYYPRMKSHFTLANTLIIIAGISYFIFTYVTDKSLNHGIQGWGLPCFTLLWSIVQLERCGFVFKPRFLMYFGKISYSLYLVHMNVQNIFIKLFKRLPGGIEGHIPSFLLLSLGSCLIAAHYSNKYIEDKACNYLKNKWKNFRLSHAKSIKVDDYHSGS